MIIVLKESSFNGDKAKQDKYCKLRKLPKNDRLTLNINQDVKRMLLEELQDHETSLNDLCNEYIIQMIVHNGRISSPGNL